MSSFHSTDRLRSLVCQNISHGGRCPASTIRFRLPPRAVYPVGCFTTGRCGTARHRCCEDAKRGTDDTICATWTGVWRKAAHRTVGSLLEGSVHGGITERQAEGGIGRKYLAESGGMPRRSTNFILRPAKCFSRPGAIFDIFSQQSVVPPNMTVYTCYTVNVAQHCFSSASHAACCTRISP